MIDLARAPGGRQGVHPTDVRAGLRGGILLFGGIAALIAADLISDWHDGADLRHLAGEILVVVLAMVGLAWLLARLREVQTQAHELRGDLDAARREAERFRQEAAEALRGLSCAIDAQFERWGLSAAEREVGLLLLKGLSHKEIAGARGTSESTVRQQALALYRKSGLGGRNELSAFFLEDLLLPAEPGRATTT